MLRYVYLYYFVFENLRNFNVRYGIEVIGDNLDVIIIFVKMIMLFQRKSFYWFLIMVKEKRIIVDDVYFRLIEEDGECRNVFNLLISEWLFFLDEFYILIENMKFYSMKVFINYVDFFKFL